METFGLIIALIVLVVTVLTFGYDGYRWISGRQTISERIWKRITAWREGTGPFTWWPLVIVSWWSLGAIGLAIHFFL